MSSGGEYLIDEVYEIVFDDITKAVKHNDWSLDKKNWIDVWETHNLPVDNEVNIVDEDDNIIGSVEFSLRFDIEGDMERYIETHVDTVKIKLLIE